MPAGPPKSENNNKIANKKSFVFVKLQKTLLSPAGPPKSQKNDNKFVKNFEKTGFFLQKTLY